MLRMGVRDCDLLLGRSYSCWFREHFVELVEVDTYLIDDMELNWGIVEWIMRIVLRVSVGSCWICMINQSR